MLVPLLNYPGLSNRPCSGLGVTYVTTAVDTVDRSTYTFSSTSLGAAAFNRWIYIFIYNGASTGFKTATSVTIGGVAATKITSADSTYAGAALWRAFVPTGTTGDIVVSLDGTTQRCGVSVYRVAGLYPEVTDLKTTAADSTSPQSVSLNCPARGVILAGAYGQHSAIITGVTWIGATEQVDASFADASGARYSSAFATGANYGATTVQVTWSAAPANGSALIAISLPGGG